MDVKIKERWIKALTSGEYEQGKSRLRTSDNKYCCLGVLCDLYVKDGQGKWEWEEFGEYWTIGMRSGYMPMEVAEWAGLDNNYGKLEGDSYYSSLTKMNDVGRSFQEIAARIKEKF